MNKLILFEKPKGYTIQIGFDENWKPHFSHNSQEFCTIRPRIDGEIAYNGGIRIDFGIGAMRRPIPKFWKKAFWSSDYAIKNPETNPWNSGNHWFVLTIPFFPYMFLSCMFGRWSSESKIGKFLGKIYKDYDEYMPGFYMGGRTAEMGTWSHWLAKYNENGDVAYWQTDKEGNQLYAWGAKEEEGNTYVELTASIRTDFLH